MTETFVIGCPGCRRAVRCELGKTGARCPICHAELPSNPPLKTRQVGSTRRVGARPGRVNRPRPPVGRKVKQGGIGGGFVTKKQMALIHKAKHAVGLSDENYRAVLESFGAVTVNGIATSKALTQGGFVGIMNHFHKLGFPWVPKGPDAHTASGRGPLLTKISAQLKDLGQDEAYANGIAWKMFRADSIRFLKPAQLYKVVAALTYAQQRQRERKCGGASATAAGGVGK